MKTTEGGGRFCHILVFAVLVPSRGREVTSHPLSGEETLRPRHLIANHRRSCVDPKQLFFIRTLIGKSGAFTAIGSSLEVSDVVDTGGHTDFAKVSSWPSRDPPATG